MKNVRELETYGAILIGCGIMAYTLMLASVDAPVWSTIEFVMGSPLPGTSHGEAR